MHIFYIHYLQLFPFIVRVTLSQVQLSFLSTFSNFGFHLEGRKPENPEKTPGDKMCFIRRERQRESASPLRGFQPTPLHSIQHWIPSATNSANPSPQMATTCV